METKQKVILYVDDDPDDREFLSIAIKEIYPEVELVIAENGLEALNYLGTIKEKNATLPGLIVLDINMPFLDGKETFQRLKMDNNLQKVPVMVFSSSEKPTDIAMFNNLGVEYFTKPTDISYFRSIVSHMVSRCA